MHQEEQCLESEETRKDINDEFALDMRNEYFDDSEEIEKWLECDETEEESQHETEDSFCRTFDGQCFCLLCLKHELK